MRYRSRRERIDAVTLRLMCATLFFIVGVLVVGIVGLRWDTLLIVGTILLFVEGLIGSIFGTPGSE